MAEPMSVQALVVASPSGSPDHKKPRHDNDEEQDAEKALDAMLAANGPLMERDSSDAPAWAVAMQNSLQIQIQRSHSLMMTFHDRLQRLEQQDKHPEFEQRLQKLEELVANSRDHGARQPDRVSEPVFSRVPPPQASTSPGSRTPTHIPPEPREREGAQTTLTDYCHIIVGAGRMGARGTTFFQLLEELLTYINQHLKSMIWLCTESDPQCAICISKGFLTRKLTTGTYG